MYLFQKKNYSPYHLFKLVPRIPTIDELARGKFGNVEKVLRHNQRVRNLYGESSRGYTPNRNQRKIANITMEVIKHPELGKYFQNGMDRHERKKAIFRFLQKYPMFKTVDKL